MVASFGPTVCSTGEISRSEQGRELNCTPNSGPLPRFTVAGLGGKVVWVISLAVRVEKALPPEER